MKSQRAEKRNTVKPSTDGPRRLWAVARRMLIALLVVGWGGASDASTMPRLRDAIGAAQLIVAGRVGEVGQPGSRVTVAEVAVRETIAGAAPGAKVAIIEWRDFRSAPPLFETDRRVVGFLVPASMNSHLRSILPEGTYFELVQGEIRALGAASESEALELIDLVKRAVKLAKEPPVEPAARAAQERQVVFDLVAAPHPLLVKDAAASLTEIPGLAASLTSDEQTRVEQALARPDLPPAVRIALIEAIGAAGLRALVPALRSLDEPTMLPAAWDALARLGSPADPDQLKELLSSQRPQVRAAAVRELLDRAGEAAIAAARAIALRDPDTEARVAAIEALGGTKSAEALPVLESAFKDSSLEIRQAAVRALVSVGGRPAAESFGRLAFEAPSEDAQRHAVSALLLLRVPREDPVLKNIARNHPNEELRELATEGIEVGHHH